MGERGAPSIRPVRYRALVLLAVAAILPVLAFAAANAYFAWQRERDAIEEDALARAGAVMQAVDRELIAQVNLVHTLAQLPDFEMVAGGAAAQQILARLHGTQPLWLAALVATPDGTIYADTQLPVPGRIVDMTSLRLAVDSRAPVIGNVGVGSTGPGIPVRAPSVRDGAVTHVLTVVLDPSALRDLLLRTSIPAGWIGVVVDSVGGVAARSAGDPSLIGRPASESVRRAIATGSGGLFQGTTLEGVSTVTAYQVSPLTGWSTHIGVPYDLYTAPLRNAERFIVLGALVSLLLAGVFVLLLFKEARARREEEAAVEQMRRMESLGRLTGGIAHDFNNLLMVVLNGVEILRRRFQNVPAAERHLAAIRTAGDRGTELIRQLLHFARGGDAARVIAVDINQHLRRTVGILSEVLGSDIRVETNLAAEVSCASADPVQFELALLNLASNARDAMNGSGVLRIETKLVEEPLKGDRRWVSIVVSDTGAGIAGRDLPFVFEPFFTTKKVGAGTGLGLTQVYAFAKQCGGSATIASTSGTGTTVELRLPVADAATFAATPAVVASPVGAPALGSARTALLVDDNDGVRAATRDVLEELALNVVEASNADAALTVLQAGGIDLVLTDIMMPGSMDGLGLAREIRRLWPHLPVVMTSGYSASASTAESEGWRVVPKPFDLNTLKDAIDHPRAASRQGA